MTQLLAVYYSLGNLDASVRSSIDTIQLVLLCKQKYLKNNVDINKFFHPLIKDLKRIENEGVDLGRNFGVKKGSVVFILGDNLGSHMIGGFTTNFSAVEYYCRYCFANRTDLKLDKINPQFYEHRNRNNYKVDCNIMSENPELSNSHGIKSNSIFNELRYFHVVDPGLPPCIGHDLFEGVVKVDLNLILNKIILEYHWFTYDQLNLWIKRFKFLNPESLDKPCYQSSKCISGHAVQVWTLLRMIPLLVPFGRVQHENKFWNLLLLLREVVNWACKPFYDNSDVVFMDDCIVEYFNLRNECFPGSLKPKHHYVFHIPMLTLLCGPLIKLWTLRFESKHSYFKSCLRSLKNYINITKTLAESHQLLQAMYSEGSLFPPHIIQNEDTIPFSLTLYSQEIQKSFNDYFPNLSDHEFFQTKKVIYSKISYSLEIVLPINRRSLKDVSFGTLKLILIHKGVSVYFILQLINTVYIDELGLYKVIDICPENEYICVSINDLLDKCPLNLYQVQGDSFIVLKHSI